MIILLLIHHILVLGPRRRRRWATGRKGRVLELVLSDVGLRLLSTTIILLFFMIVADAVIIRSKVLADLWISSRHWPKRPFKVLKDGLELDDRLVQFRKVRADVGVDGHDIPRCNHEIVEVGKGGPDDVVEEIDLDVG